TDAPPAVAAAGWDRGPLPYAGTAPRRPGRSASARSSSSSSEWHRVLVQGPVLRPQLHCVNHQDVAVLQVDEADLQRDAVGVVAETEDSIAVVLHALVFLAAMFDHLLATLMPTPIPA